MRLTCIAICLIGVVLSGSHEAEVLAQWPYYTIYLRDGSKKIANPLLKVDDSHVEFGYWDKEDGRLAKDKVSRSEVDLICFANDCEWVSSRNFSKDLVVRRDGRKTLGYISSVVGPHSSFIIQNNSRIRITDVKYIKFAAKSLSARSPSASVKQTRVLGFNAEGRKVYDNPRIQGEIWYWPWTKEEIAQLQPGTYFLLYEIERSYDLGARSLIFSKFSKLSDGIRTKTLGEIKADAGAQQQTEFFNIALQELPQAPELWLRYAAALQNQWRYRRPVRSDNQKVPEMGVDHEKLKTNLPTALAALQKAVELAGDCETKSSAMEQLSLVYADAGETEKSRDWALKRADLPCATPKLAPVR